VIGTGSVVTKDCEPYGIVAGVPAKQVKRRFGDETVARLMQLRWWDWSEEKIKQNINLFYDERFAEKLDPFCLGSATSQAFKLGDIAVLADAMFHVTGQDEILATKR